MARPPVPSPYYRVSVKAVVADGDGRLLVIHNEHGSWEIPGGGWEHGESLEQCLIREIGEELGVGVRRIDTTNVHPCVGFGHGQAWLKLLVPAELEGPPFALGDGMAAARFVSAADFAALTMHPADQMLQLEMRQFWPAP